MPVTVHIRYNPGTGQIQVFPDPVAITLDDEIEWDSNDSDFVVHFPNRKPFSSRLFHRRMRSGRPVVASGGAPYKYEVIVHGDCIDPEVVIEDPKG
jgi:hypothetical protein